MKIGIENFRIFKSKTDIEIKPLTLLIGPNNSGKSNFSKLLKILQNDVEKLEFDTRQIHQINNFQDCLSFNSNRKDFKIDYTFPNTFLNYNTKKELIYEKGKLKTKNVYIENDKIISFFEEVEIEVNYFENQPIGSIELFKNSLYFDINTFLDYFFRSSIDVESLHNFYKEKYMQIHKGFDNFYTRSADFRKIFIKELLVVEENAKKYNNIILSFKNNKSYSLFSVFKDDENVTYKFQNYIEELQIERFKNFTNHKLYSSEKAFDENLSESLLLNIQNLKSEISNKLNGESSAEKYKIILSDLYTFIFEIFQNIELNNDIKISSHILFDNFIEHQSLSKKFLNNISYIGANRGSQNRVIYHFDKSEFASLFQSILNKDYDEEFINQALEILGIDGKIYFETFENSAFVPFIIRGDNRIAFSDLGFGISQLFPIILKLSLAINGVFDYIFIEEPEANLHPNLQSKLADLFLLAYQKQHNLKLVIETHSEYLLRKIQYFAAGKTINNNDIQIYYFNDDRFVTESEPKVKPISVNEKGNLTEEFGPGFYDEAISLRFDLLQLNNIQHN